MSDHGRAGLDALQVDPSVPELSQEGNLGRVGPYTLVKWLGSGGMGRVFLGREVSGAGRLVAVKVIRPEYAEDAQFRKRFEREVAALERVQGPYLARLMGSGLDEHQVWMATEYIPAPSLAEAVDEHGPLDAAAAWRLTADLVQAIQAMARAGIVHRDLKPSNVLLATDGARVIDFGVAQAAETSSITTTGHFVGTAAYMSPEQARGKPVTTASDVFSVGCTLAYAVAARAPFGDGTGVDVMHRVAYEPPGDDVLAAVGAVDPDLATLIMGCLAKEPEKRPSPDALFATAVAHQIPGTGTGPRDRTPVGPPEPTPAATDPASGPAAPSATRKRRLLLMGAAIVTALTVAGGVVTLLGTDEGRPSAGSGPAAYPTAQVSPTTARPLLAAASTPAATPAPLKKASKKPASASARATPRVDPATLDIRSAACPATLTFGASGDCVRALQILLGGWGIYTAVDGRLGQQSLSAVKVFQTGAGILADGNVDAQTKTLLYSADRGPVQTGTLTVTEQINGVDQARCLESGSARVGRNVQVWACDGTLGQQWALHRVPGQDGQYILVAQAGHGCLDADQGTAGTNGQLIQGPPCTGLTAQRWRLGDRKASGAQALISVPNGFCLDADAGTNGQDGQRVQGWGCAGTSPQDWTWR